MPLQHGGAGWTLSGFLASVLLLLAGVARADTGLHAGDDLQRFVTVRQPPPMMKEQPC